VSIPLTQPLIFLNEMHFSIIDQCILYERLFSFRVNSFILQFLFLYMFLQSSSMIIIISEGRENVNNRQTSLHNMAKCTAISSIFFHSIKITFIFALNTIQFVHEWAWRNEKLKSEKIDLIHMHLCVMITDHPFGVFFNDKHFSATLIYFHYCLIFFHFFKKLHNSFKKFIFQPNVVYYQCCGFWGWEKMIGGKFVI
jgi:hypothetical protein